jgi:hypothetical protein
MYSYLACLGLRDVHSVRTAKAHMQISGVAWPGTVAHYADMLQCDFRTLLKMAPVKRAALNLKLHTIGVVLDCCAPWN